MKGLNLNGSKTKLDKCTSDPLPQVAAFDLQNSPSEVNLPEICEKSECKLVISGRERAGSDYTDTTIGTNDFTEKQPNVSE